MKNFAISTLLALGGVSMAHAQDTTPPTVSIVAPTGGATVSGTVQWNVNATDNVGVNSVMFFIDGMAYSITFSSPYFTGVSTTNLLDGPHTFLAIAYDKANNEARAQVVVNVLNGSPVIAITEPAAGRVGGVITVSASATDPDGIGTLYFRLMFPDSVTQYQFLGKTSALPYLITWDTRSAPGGYYDLEVSGSDRNGNVGRSAPVRIRVDNNPPSCSLVAPVSGATLSGTILCKVSTSSVWGIARVEFYRDNLLLRTLSTSPYEFQWDTRGETDGAHTLYAKAIDAVGNARSTSPISVNLGNISTDTAPPTCSITAPTDGATVSGMVPCSASAGDNVAVAKVEFRVDGVLVGSDTTSPYSLSWDSTSAPNGSHTLQARAFDTSNNVTAASISVNVGNASADTTAPSIAISSPTTSSTYATSLGVLTLAGSASDNVGVTGVTWSNTAGGGGVASGTGSWSAGVTLAQGSNTITVTARDAGGNTGTDSLTVTYNVPDTTAPTTPGSLVATAASSSQINLSWNASTDSGGSGLAGYKIDRSLDGTTFSQIALTSATSFSNTGLSASRSYFYRVRAYDNASNHSGTSNIANATTPAPADTTPPACSITSPLNGAIVSGTITISATATDIVGVTEVRFSVGGSPLALDSSSPFSTTWDSRTVPNGSVVLYAAAYDAAGNYDVDSITVTVSNSTLDTTPPATPTGLTVTRTRVKGSFVDSLSWNPNTEADIAGYRLYRSTSTSGPFTLVSSHSRTQTSTRLSVGKKPPTYFYVLRAVDSSGNESAASNAVTAS